MTDTHDGLAGHDRIFLEKIRLATQVLLSAAEEEPGLLNAVIESELGLVRDKIDLALLRSSDVPRPA